MKKIDEDGFDSRLTNEAAKNEDESEVDEGFNLRLANSILEKFYNSNYDFSKVR